MLDHAGNILKYLPHEKAEILVPQSFSNKESRIGLKRIQNIGLKVNYIKDVIYKLKYKLLVSNHYISGEFFSPNKSFERFKQISVRLINNFHRPNYDRVFNYTFGNMYLPLKLGHINVKFMTGLDIGKWHLSDWNNIYDYFLCHSKFDQSLYVDLFNKPSFIMGYPKYFNENYEDSNQNILSISKNLNQLDKSKKTILLIPTVSAHFSTILLYYDTFLLLSTKFNIICRPHPLESHPDNDRFNPKMIKVIEESPFFVVKEKNIQIRELYKLADYVCTDYGGSVFSAIFFRKNTILLNNANAHKDESIRNSTSLLARDFIPSVECDNQEDLHKYLHGNFGNSSYIKNIDKAREHFFGNVDDISPQEAAQFLINILDNNYHKIA